MATRISSEINLRKPSEKKLVDAIIDGEVEAQRLAEKAKGFGSNLGFRLTQISKAIVSARMAGRLSTEEAKAAFREAYLGLTLAGFVEVAQEVVDHSTKVAADVHAAAVEHAPELTKTSPIRKADFIARELEKANGKA